MSPKGALLLLKLEALKKIYCGSCGGILYKIDGDGCFFIVCFLCPLGLVGLFGRLFCQNRHSHILCIYMYFKKMAL